ncbi:amino acid ABC transporter permease [Bradyrhizobium iriomotense]|uniref:amino acid ABC transporter permease n=1 Tax=Bradyrhizobium iriomotense TaxID=441950 RepID=UPI001FE866EE|nr:amino acid ABC transporter permease [Bradyrhizobium iriomotense]MBR0782110.1 amino acid ABC transporter permease [Bradyrhizobium iriomotense]
MIDGFDWAYLYDTLPALLRGLRTTLIVSVIAILLSLAIGAIGAVMRLSGRPFLVWPARGYVAFIRNTPLLVQLFFIFYGLPVIGVRLSAFWSGVVCLSIWGGCYHLESFRAGYVGVSQGTRDAARALGLKAWQYALLVALPIALRTAVPSMANTSIAMLKNSSYLQAIGLAELTFVAIDRNSLEFRTIELFAAICIFYLVLVLAMSAGATKLESYLQRPFLAR